ncbi:MAG: Fic family protein [Bacteroidales bacterium]|nr:Fic family protein [Bacteroidales bacterium]
MDDMYIWQQKDFPNFTWDSQRVLQRLSEVKFCAGKLSGIMGTLGFEVKETAAMDSITSDIIMSSAIEGITLNRDDVRSSVAWQLGLDKAGIPASNQYIEGVVEVMLDAIKNCNEVLTKEKLFRWHTLLFPSPMRLERITVGAWRNSPLPMQVVSGRYGKEKVHYEAPDSSKVPEMMDVLLDYIANSSVDGILKAAIAHLWFVTIHPFGDGNGRLGRTIMDMLLARYDGTQNRFYSMSAAIAENRKAYYDVLERTQKGGLDISEWMLWFLDCLESAINKAIGVTNRTLQKAVFWSEHSEVVFNSRQIKIINMLWDGFDGKLQTGKWAKINRCSTDTALRDIQDLVSKGVLKKESNGRSTEYVLHSDN